MPFTMQINVAAGRAALLQMPRLAEGSKGVVSLAVSFDESWNAFPTRTAIFWREGEAVLRLPLDADGGIVIPSVFTLSDEPFLVRVMGENAEQCIQTNELCARFEKLDSLDAQEPQYTVYDGAYTLTENKTYSMRDYLMAKDLTVAVPTVDTSQDTVSPETLLPGVTAHDADGKPIVGAYSNPYNANTAQDTVTPQTLFHGVTAHDANGKSIAGEYINPYNADTTEDTVTPQTLLRGTTAHDASGDLITGSYNPPETGFINLVKSQVELDGGTTIKEN